MNELDKLALKYGCDKSSNSHFYTKWYEKIFKDIREDVKNLLEIGIFKGQSLNMWKDYFPKATIYGLDIDKNCKQYESNRIKITIGNQLDQLCITQINDEFDIIIDDGGHYMNQQIETFKMMFPYIKKNGYYVIEDLHTSYLNPYQNYHITAVDFLKSLLDDLNMRGKTWIGNKEKSIKECNQKNIELNYYEKNINSIQFFKDICFIKKVD